MFLIEVCKAVDSVGKECFQRIKINYQKNNCARFCTGRKKVVQNLVTQTIYILIWS